MDQLNNMILWMITITTLLILPQSEAGDTSTIGLSQINDGDTSTIGLSQINDGDTSTIGLSQINDGDTSTIGLSQINDAIPCKHAAPLDKDTMTAGLYCGADSAEGTTCQHSCNSGLEYTPGLGDNPPAIECRSGKWTPSSLNPCAGLSEQHKPPVIVIFNWSLPIKTDVTLHCQATGHPNPTIGWWVSNTSGSPWEEVDFNEHGLTKRSTSTIYLNYFSKNEGHYRCSASNKWGTTFSDSVHVPYSFIKIIDVNIKIRNITINAGDSVKMDCSRIKSQPETKTVLQWARGYEGERPIKLDGRRSIADNGSLIIGYVKADEGDYYSCIVKNSNLDTRMHVRWHLTVKQKTFPNVKPHILYATNASVILRGHNHTLRCSARAIPTATIRLAFEGIAPPNIDDTRIGTLFIREADFHNAGRYTCSAANDHGSDLYEWHLTVESSPYWESEEDKPRNLEVAEGGTAEFNCKPAAVPEAKVVWMKNGEVLDASDPGPKIQIHGSKLVVKEVCKNCDEPDRANYQCEVRNKHGIAYGFGSLNVFTKTIMTVRPRDHDLTNLFGQSEITKIELQCDANGDQYLPLLQFLWYKNDYSLDIKTKTLTLSVADYATEEDMYEALLGTYKCKATNGVSSAFAEAVITGELKPTTSVFTEEPDRPKYFVWTYVIIGVSILVGLLVVSFISFMVYLYTREDQNDEDGPNGSRMSSRVSGVSGRRRSSRRQSGFLKHRISHRQLSRFGLGRRRSSRRHSSRVSSGRDSENQIPTITGE